MKNSVFNGVNDSAADAPGRLLRWSARHDRNAFW